MRASTRSLEPNFLPYGNKLQAISPFRLQVIWEALGRSSADEDREPMGHPKCHGGILRPRIGSCYTHLCGLVPLGKIQLKCPLPPLPRGMEKGDRYPQSLPQLWPRSSLHLLLLPLPKTSAHPHTSAVGILIQYWRWQSDSMTSSAKCPYPVIQEFYC